MAKLNAILRQIQQASTGNTWDSGMSGTQLDTTKLDAILKQLQAGAATGSGTGWSDGGSWYKSGNWSVNIPPSVFITSGGKAATIKGKVHLLSGLESFQGCMDKCEQQTSAQADKRVCYSLRIRCFNFRLPLSTLWHRVAKSEHYANTHAA